MPGFSIDTGSAGSDSNGEPRVELYHSDDIPSSMIQKTALEQIDDYSVEVYNVEDNPGKVSNNDIRRVPTVIAKDDGYEISRWETVTHVDDILEVLDEW